MYETSEKGTEKIRYDLLRQKSIEELESIIKLNPQDNLVRAVIEDSILSMGQIEMSESDLIKYINKESEDVCQLFAVDRTTGKVYERNLDWEMFGGRVYNEIGKIDPETAKSVELHERVFAEEDLAKNNPFSF